MPKQSARLMLVNDVNFLLYTPFLPEAAAGTLEPRHVVTPLREILNRTYLRLGAIDGHDPAARTVELRTHEGETEELRYDQLLLALGSVSRIAAGARPRRARDRLQEPRRRDLAAQPRRRDARGGQRDRGPGAARGAAHLRLRRRRLRRPRGAGRAAGLRRRRDGQLPARPPARDALGPRRGHRPGPAGDRPPARRLRAAGAARPRDRHPPRHHARGGDRRQRPALDRGDAADQDRGLDRRRHAAPQPAAAQRPARRARPGAGRRIPAGRGDGLGLGDRRLRRGARPAAAGLSPPTAQHAVRQGPVAARNIAAELGVGSARPFTYRGRRPSSTSAATRRSAGSAGGPSAASPPGGWPAPTT